MCFFRLVTFLTLIKSARIGIPDLEATFETLVDSFVFLDKNKDGYVSKSEMVHAINESTSGERSSGRIAMKRFGVSSPFLLIINSLNMLLQL